ncbi:MAG: tetratricopeptide repeat protein [Treponema sp.]|nr:tetratricopeptide repeat protein [Treponema sp.]
MKDRLKLEPTNYAKRRNPWIKRGIFIFIAALLILGALFSSQFIIKKIQSKHVSISSIKKAWSSYDYQSVYELSKKFLEEKPYNNTALAYYCYSCFFLSQAQSDTQSAQNYLDECINNARIAIYNASKSLKPQLYYMLGRAYFYKNTISSHYYADLAVKYLLLAKEAGYEADDIPEYLGLSYAALGMPMDSISSFTEALLIRESDSLLLAIAEQYCEAGENNAAKQYLFRNINNSKNDEIIIKSQLLLGNIYIADGDYEAALDEFNNVLKKNENSADAHYGIGVIYEKQGNIVKARSEWRKALKIQVNHAGALQKLSEY